MATKTVFTCDRCGSEHNSKVSITEVSVQSKASETAVIRSVDLCLDCTGSFWHVFVKTEPARTYSLDDF